MEPPFTPSATTSVPRRDRWSTCSVTPPSSRGMISWLSGSRRWGATQVLIFLVTNIDYSINIIIYPSEYNQLYVLSWPLSVWGINLFITNIAMKHLLNTFIFSISGCLIRRTERIQQLRKVSGINHQPLCAFDKYHKWKFDFKTVVHQWGSKLDLLPNTSIHQVQVFNKY